MIRTLILSVIPALVLAQRHRVNINTETPAGLLLQSIGQETQDAGRKLALMEEFAKKYSKHDSVAWVLDQLVASYLKANQFDQVLASGQQLLAVDPDDVAAAHSCLKAAEGKKDTALITQWAGTTSKLARKAAGAPQPKEEDAVENWKNMVDYAKQVDTYTEYSLYAATVASADPAQRIQLRSALIAQNPQSQYVPQLNTPYFYALRQANQNDKAVEFAESILEKDQSNEDMLLAVADSYLTRKTSPEKVVAYGNKLAELMSSKPKPEGVSDDDWNKRKTLLMGLGYWMAGVTHGAANKFAECDEVLRKALPLVEGNDQLKAQALFYLGLANYKMGDSKKDKKMIADALRFNVQCSAIKSPFQGQAVKNATVIRQQYGLK